MPSKFIRLLAALLAAGLSLIACDSVSEPELIPEDIAPQASTLSVQNARVINEVLEVGNLRLAQANAEDWLKVNLQQSYANPVVMTQPLSYNGGQPATVRLRNVSANSFELQIDEWDYLDGGHIEEALSYLVMEAGSTSYDGLDIVAGTVQVGPDWTPVALSGFTAKPVAFSQVQSANGASAVITRQRSVASSGLELRLQSEEANPAPATETVGYVVFERGGGKDVGVTYTSETLNDAWKSVNFRNTYQAPVLLAAMQTFNGADTANLRQRKLTGNSVEIKVEEEKSADSELSHANEVLGYLVLEGAGGEATEPPTNPEPPTPPGPSANLCEGFDISTDQVSIPRLAKPEPLASYTDPAFGADVTRVSSAGAGGVVKPMYNTVQAWNADETRMILYHAGTEDSGHHLYNGKTYERIRKLDILPADIEQVFWDPTDARYFYYVSKRTPDYGDLIRYDVTSDQKTALRAFDNVCGGDYYPSSGNDVQMMSLDGDTIGLRCKNATSANPVDKTFSYTISTDTLSPVKQIGEGTDYAPWYAAQPAPSGERFFLGGNVLDTSLNELRSLDVYRRSDGSYKGEHAVLGQFPNGNDALFTVAFYRSPNGCDGGAASGLGSVVSHDLETGQCRVLAGEDNGYGYPLSGVHHSALSYQNPGWVAATSIGSRGQLDDYLYNGETAPVLLSELYLADADPANPQVCRLAHTRTYGKSAQNGGYNPYFGEPHAVISPSGTRILFGSDWYDSGAVDTFVVELPSYQP